MWTGQENPQRACEEEFSRLYSLEQLLHFDLMLYSCMENLNTFYRTTESLRPLSTIRLLHICLQKVPSQPSLGLNILL